MARARRRSKLRRRAQRDVGLVIRPQLRELGRQRRQIRGEYRDQDAKVGQLYNILDQTLASGGAAQQQALGQIGNTYQTGVQGILDALGQSAAPDQQGFLGTLGSFALAGQNQLSTDRAREANFGASTRRQGGLERMQFGRNMRDDLQEAMDDIRFARRGIMADRGSMVLSRLDQLRDTSFSQRMAQAELALRRAAVARESGNDAAMASFLRDYGANALGGPNKKKKRRRKKKPGGSGGGTAIAGKNDKRRQ